MNKALLTGRLTKDPVLEKTKNNIFINQLKLLTDLARSLLPLYRMPIPAFL